ncbi:hypothetical protein NE562_05525 [Butyricicoccus faecihominis]|uniref:hypothetical protein n=1 Tax=Butyricicoccus faecihominis TaxID=1712515 RepID=UPI0024787812|nr:hypothetical protein [Butyricicoccus faecihominis]MCQ5129112.1 hypothetical protein [Butyricicoccus faecihominis]
MTNVEKLVRFCSENDNDTTQLFLALLCVAGEKMRVAESADDFLDRLSPAEVAKIKSLAAGGARHV